MKMQCSVFLMLLAVLVSLVLPIGQPLICRIGERLHTPANKGPDVCVDCLPGTFMNLTIHSKRDCFPCSTCPGSVGRPCNLTSDTVCCPLPNMTVVDTETGAQCMIAASQPQPGHGINQSDEQQVSDSGKIHNNSDNGDLHASNNNAISCAGHILATCMFVYVMYAHISPLLPVCCKCRQPAPVCGKWTAVIAVAVCVAVVFTQLDNDAENICFLVCVCFTIIFCIVYELCKFATNFKGRLKYAVQGIKHTGCAASNPTGGDLDDPEYQSSDPLVSDSETPELALDCQDGHGLPAFDSLDENDRDISVLGSTAECRPGRSLTATMPDLATRYVDKQQACCPITTDCSPRRSLHEITVGLDAPHITTQQDSSSTAAGDRFLAASEQYAHSVAEDNHDPNDTRIHGAGPPASRQVVPTEPIKLASGCEDSYSAKLGQSGCSRGEDAYVDETEMTHDQLALNLRSESSAPESIFIDVISPE